MLIDFEEVKHKLNNSRWYGTQVWYEILDIIGDCDDKSRPKGHYIKGENGEWYCSNCKRIDDKYSVAKFCWNCGAKMEVKEDATN